MFALFAHAFLASKHLWNYVNGESSRVIRFHISSEIAGVLSQFCRKRARRNHKLGTRAPQAPLDLTPLRREIVKLELAKSDRRFYTW